MHWLPGLRWYPTHAASSPRTLAGITVTLSWRSWPNYDPEAVPGDGGLVTRLPHGTKVWCLRSARISAISNGGTIATGGQTAAVTTDANGMSTITITSQVTGFTPTQAVATYAGNPYPGDLFSHETFTTTTTLSTGNRSRMSISSS